MNLFPGMSITSDGWKGTILLRYNKMVYFVDGNSVASDEVKSNFDVVPDSVVDVIDMTEYLIKTRVLKNFLLVSDANDLAPKEYVWYETLRYAGRFSLGYVAGYPTVATKTVLNVISGGKEIVLSPEYVRMIKTGYYFDPSQ